MVLYTVDSPRTRRAYRRALADFLTWQQKQSTLPLTKALLKHYRASLLDQGVGASSINQRLPAIRKSGARAADH